MAQSGSAANGREPLWQQTDKSLRARIAAAERWGRTADRVAATAPAPQGLSAKFEREVDPEGALPVAERRRRAEALMRAHMLRLARGLRGSEAPRPVAVGLGSRGRLTAAEWVSSPVVVTVHRNPSGSGAHG